MGLKNFVDRMKKRAKESAEELKDPEKREALQVKRAQQALDFAHKTVATFQSASEKVDSAKEKAADILEQAEPTAEAIDKAASDIAEKGKTALKNLRDRFGKKDDTTDTTAENDNTAAPKNAQPKTKNPGAGAK